MNTQNGCINFSIDNLNMQYEEDISLYSICIMPSFEIKMELNERGIRFIAIVECRYRTHPSWVSMWFVVHFVYETKCAERFYRFLFLTFCRNICDDYRKVTNTHGAYGNYQIHAYDYSFSFHFAFFRSPFISLFLLSFSVLTEYCERTRKIIICFHFE